jgi:hypothetical protein
MHGTLLRYCSIGEERDMPESKRALLGEGEIREQRDTRENYKMQCPIEHLLTCLREFANAIFGRGFAVHSTAAEMIGQLEKLDQDN